MSPPICSIPDCVYNKKEEDKQSMPSRRFFSVMRPEFAKTPEEKEHRQTLTNIMLQLRDSSQGDPIKNQLHRERVLICDKHFFEEDFTGSSKRKLLKQGAIPVLNMPKLTYQMKMRLKERTRSLKRANDKKLHDKSDGTPAKQLKLDETTSKKNNSSGTKGVKQPAVNHKSVSSKEQMWNMIVRLKNYCSRTNTIMDNACLVDAHLANEFSVISDEIGKMEHNRKLKKITKAQEKYCTVDDKNEEDISTSSDEDESDSSNEEDASELSNTVVEIHEINSDVHAKTEDLSESETEVQEELDTISTEISGPIPLSNLDFLSNCTKGETDEENPAPISVQVAPIIKGSVENGKIVTSIQPPPFLIVAGDNHKYPTKQLNTHLTTLDGNSVTLNLSKNAITKSDENKIQKMFYSKYIVPHDKWGQAYKCDCCDDDHLFEKWYKLRRHQNRNVQKKCDICDKVFSKSYFLSKRHMDIHLHEKKFECEKCGKKFRQNNHLKAHMESPFSCKFPSFECDVGLCGKQFMKEEEVQKHLFEMHNMCNVCEDKFTDKCVKERHHIVILSPYICSYCQVSFSFKPELVKHVKSEHPEHATREMKYHPKTHVCELCDKTFPLPSLLKAHVKTHTTHKKKAEHSRLCEYCSKYFKNNSGLKRHIERFHAD